MSAYVELLNHASDHPLGRGFTREVCLVEANHQIPILWLALFDVEDLSTVEFRFEDEGEEDVTVAPSLFAATSTAKSRYARRREALKAALGSECLSCFDEWDDFLERHLTAPFVEVEMDELYGVYGDTFAEEVALWIKGLDTPGSPEWDELCSQACINDDEVRKFGVRGFAAETELNWED